MVKSNIVNTKSRGRPKTTGTGSLIGTRWHAAELAAIDEWREKQDDKPSRNQAIRRLVEVGLKGSNRRAAK